MSAANENPRAVALLRVLNGPLRGAEYALSPGNTLLITASDDHLVDAAVPDLPSNSILLPSPGSVNVELDVGRGDTFRVRELCDPSDERDGRYQEVIKAGSLSFAVRRINEAWDPTFLSRVVDGAESASRGGKWVMAGMAAGVMLLAVGWASFSLGGKREPVDLVDVTAGGSVPYRVIEGKGGHFHVFAQSERDASWARQSLVRQGRSAEVKVAVQRMEEKRLSYLLAEHFPGIRHHRIRLDDPRYPLLALSQERTALDASAVKAVTESLLRWMPYAQAVVVDSWSDRVIDTRARQGLERLGISYIRQADSTVTYRVKGDLDDADIAAVREFMTGFYRRYGSNYVHFSVELSNEDFKGKSFGYGQRHYVKQAPGHWQFL